MQEDFRTKKSKRKFDLDIVMQSWIKVSVFEIVIVLMLIAIIATFSRKIDLTSVVAWACLAFIGSALRIFALRSTRQLNSLVLNNFKLVRTCLAVITGPVYGTSVYLFMDALSPAGQTYFSLAILLSTYASVPIFYDFIAGYVIRWSLTWIPLKLYDAQGEDGVLIHSVGIAALITGIFLCRTFYRIFANTFDLHEEIASQASSLGTENSNMKMFFLASHHDLAQPLTAIEYAIQSLERSSFSSPVVQGAVRNIKTSSATLGRLIGDIIQYEKITSGNEPLNTQPTPLSSILNRVVRQVEGLADDKDIGIWARPTKRIANVDGFLLERIVRNLVENAIRNTEHGRVVVAARPRGDLISIEVWDTGVGIPPESLDSVFELFHQNARSDGKKPGLGHGIGLTIVRTLSQKIGAKVVVNSVPGRGTVFRVLVPSWRQSNVTESPPTDARAKVRLQPTPPGELNAFNLPWKDVTIGLLEDDATLRNQISGSFLSRGARVFHGKSPDEIVATIDGAAHELDVLVTDWNLGANTGEAAREMLAKIEGFHAKWIVISGDIEIKEATRLRDHGVFVLMKPFGPDRLISVVDEVLAQSTNTA